MTNEEEAKSIVNSVMADARRLAAGGTMEEQGVIFLTAYLCTCASMVKSAAEFTHQEVEETMGKYVDYITRDDFDMVLGEMLRKYNVEVTPNDDNKWGFDKIVVKKKR